MHIREATPDDYPAIVAIQNAVFPHQPAVVEDWHEADAKRPARMRHQRWMAEVDGQTVAMAQYDQSTWMNHPDKYFGTVRVLPAYQGRGIGKALYAHLEAALLSLDPLSLRIGAREDQSRAVRFLEERGFKELERECESWLTMSAFDPAAFAGTVEKVAASGIRLVSLRDLAGDPAHGRKIYALDCLLSEDIPTAEPITMPDYDEWHRDVLGNPMLLEDAYIVALAGDDYIGFSSVWADRASDMLYTGFTGVRREYRGRGIATALKVKVLQVAMARGCSIVKTWNDSTNAGMLGINTRLGFVQQPATISYQKVFRAE